MEKRKADAIELESVEKCLIEIRGGSAQDKSKAFERLANLACIMRCVEQSIGRLRPHDKADMRQTILLKIYQAARRQQVDYTANEFIHLTAVIGQRSNIDGIRQRVNYARYAKGNSDGVTDYQIEDARTCPSPVDNICEEIDRDEMMQLCAIALTPLQARAMELAVLGFGVTEIGERLGKSYFSIRRALYDARKRLQRLAGPEQSIDALRSNLITMGEAVD